MTRKFLVFACLVLLMPKSDAQKYDYNWVLGRGATAGDLLQFGDYNLHISKIDKTLPFYATNTCISDTSGSLAFSFNGIKIQNRLHQLMAVTEGLSLGILASLYNSSGAPTNQGSMALPIPGSPDRFRLFYWDNHPIYLSPDTPYTAPLHLYMAIIDLSANNGQVVEKNILVAADTFANAGIDAVKHANGRDWWIIVPEMRSNRYHTILVSPTGIDTTFVQASGAVWPPFVDITTQSCFSSDGTKFIRFNDEVGLQVFDFDRCTGLFFNAKLVPFEFNNGYFCSASISYNARFAFVTDLRAAWQYDLTASDIGATKTLIAKYDGYQNPNHCDFYLAKLAPDGKIYMNSWGGCKNLHVIEYPDRQGSACNLRQHAVPLFTYTEIGLPNLPNFRLGPLDGTNCDTLGLDNIPVAAFRGDVAGLDVDFTDLSWYNPTTWFWELGDGETSIERSPIHSYLVPGAYPVCLTVSNPFGTSKYCRTVSVGFSNLSEPDARQLILFPNPGKESLEISLPFHDPGPVWVTLVSSTGQVLYTEKMKPAEGNLDVPVHSLPNGLYICRVSNGKKTLSKAFSVMH